MLCHITGRIGCAGCHLNSGMGIVFPNVLLALGNGLGMGIDDLNVLALTGRHQLLGNGLDDFRHRMNLCLMKKVVQRFVDRPFNGIFNWNDRKINLSRFKGLDDLRDIGKSQQLSIRKGLVSNLMGKGATWPQISYIHVINLAISSGVRLSVWMTKSAKS